MLYFVYKLYKNILVHMLGPRDVYTDPLQKYIFKMFK